jgi:hypothetical protein
MLRGSRDPAIAEPAARVKKVRTLVSIVEQVDISQVEDFDLGEHMERSVEDWFSAWAETASFQTNAGNLPHFIYKPSNSFTTTTSISSRHHEEARGEIPYFQSHPWLS